MPTPETAPDPKLVKAVWLVAIMGVGATKRLSAVRWGVARGIVVAWIVTIPAAAAVAAVTYGIGSLFLP